MSKPTLLLFLLGLWVQTIMAQEKLKPVKYNAFGMGVYPSEQLMVGGNHISYRKFGFGMSWRVGIKNIQMNQEGYGDIPYDTALTKGYLTGNSKSAYSFGGTFNFVYPITPKIPIYIGAGLIRYREAAEVQPPFNAPGDTYYVINTTATKFKPNFHAGIFVPIAGRLVLNVGYDFLPGTVFAGIAISSPFNYENIDMY